MSFAGLKQKAAEADEEARRAEERAVFAKVAAGHKFAEEAVAAVEQAAAAAAPSERKALVMRMEEITDCATPKTMPGPMGFGIDWDPLRPSDLRGRAAATYDLLAKKREDLPEDERFDIELRAFPLGRGCVCDWDLSIWIKW